MTAVTPGQFVWFDLMTPDPQSAMRFYGELIGWKAEKWTDGDYSMWLAGEQRVGGVMTLPEDARKAGAPPHWLAYVAVDQVDATVERAKRLGANVMVPPSDIPGAGRFAVLTDPLGAMFAVYKATNQMEAQRRDALGHFSWGELNTTDRKKAWAFYSELFGWKSTRTTDMGAGFGDYAMFGLDTQTSIGGMSNAASMMKAPAHWLSYINVASADEAAKRVTALGGKVLNGPMDVPGGDRIAQCMDPQGATFAIYSSGKR